VIELPHYSLFQYALITVAFLVGGVVKGAVGFALPLVLLAIMTLGLEVGDILGIIVIPMFLANVWLALEGRQWRWALEQFWPEMLLLGAGVVVGANLLVTLDREIIYLLLGGAVIVFASLNLAAPSVQLAHHHRHRVGVPVGLLAGLLGGLTAVFGPPLALYLVALDLGKARYIAAMGAIWLAGSTVQVLAFSSVRLVTPSSALVALVALLPLYAGLRLGRMVRNRVDERVFRRIVALALLVSGVNLLWRGLGT